jgi:hypothetical protein
MHLEKTISRVDSVPVPGDERVSGDLQAIPDAGKKGGTGKSGEGFPGVRILTPCGV